MQAARDATNLSTTGQLATEIDPQNHFNELQAFGRTLADSNIAVYPFDAHGLQAGVPEGPQAGDDRFAQWAAADLLATESGGKALVGHNRLSDELLQIVTNGDHAYQIEYYPGEKAWDDKYHHIRLKLAPQHKGLTLLCRKGYYAADNPLAPSYENFRAAARSPVESLGIGLELNVPSNPLEWGPPGCAQGECRRHQFEHKYQNANLGVSFCAVGKRRKDHGGAY